MQEFFPVPVRTPRWLPIIIGTTIIGLAFWLWDSLLQQGQADTRQMIDVQTLSITHEVSEQLRGQMVPLLRLAREWENHERPSEKDWKSAAELYLGLYPSYHSLQWVNTDRQTQWQVIKEEATPLSNTKAFEIIDEIKYRREPWISPSFEIAPDRKGLAICLMLLDGQVPAGHLIGVIDIPSMLEAVLNKTLARGYSIAVLQDDMEIYLSDNAPSQHRQKWKQFGSFTFYQQTWRVEVWPGSSLISRDQTLPHTILGTGIVGALLLALLTLLAQKSRLHAQYVEFVNQKLNFEIDERERTSDELRKTKNDLEKRVQDRTSALSSANQDLQKQVSEREKAESALRESEIRFRSVAQSASDAIISSDSEGVIAFWNNGAQKMFGYTSEEAIGKSLSLVITEKSLKEKDLKSILAEDSKTTQFRCRRKDQSEFPTECSVASWKTGEQTFFTAIFHDITEHERVKEMLGQVADSALEASRIKAEFLANVSHEIRTPMNGIIGMTGLLLQSELTPRQREFAGSVRTCADDLLTLINDILDFSKIEAGKLRFEKLDFDIHNVIEGTVDFLAERAQAKNLELTLLIANDIPFHLVGDPGRLRQVLMNLIGNAIKFTDKGEINVRTTKENETDQTVMLRFSVKDTGIGIPEDVREKLFEPFTQADSSTSRKYGGTGLGLAISRQLILGMGGKIGVESSPDNGSEFWFTIPLEKQPQAAEPIPPPPKKGRDSIRCLVLDTNKNTCEMVINHLRSEEITCEASQSQEEALKLLKEQAADGKPFNMVLIDLQLPSKVGLELARIIKTDPAISTTRLVLMAPLSYQDNSDEMVTAGIDAYLSKPIKRSHLFDCIIQLLTLNFDASQGVFRVPGTKPRSQSKTYPVKAVAATNEEAMVIRPKPWRILVAEDNAVNQKVAIRYLSDMGYAADAVGNGLEVLDAINRIHYDLILMDCQMPEMDGYQATQEIRKREGTDKHTFIIALTAHALDADREKCTAVGMDDYISKPFNPEDLQAILEKWLEGRTPPSTPTTTPIPSPSANGQSHPASTDDAPPIDMKRLNLAAGKLPDAVESLYKLYADQTTQDLAQLSSSIKNGAMDEISKIAHKCAGASETCGMTRLGRLFRELMSHAREGKADAVPVTQGEIEKEFQRIQDFMKTQAPKPVS